MPKQKYTKRADGRYYTGVWDGTYKVNGKKNIIPVYAKSSRELEIKVLQIREKLSCGEYAKQQDVTFGKYAQIWFDTYKNIREKNTQAMYKNIIRSHLADLENKRLTDIKKSDIQGLINERQEHYRTCEQIRLTVSQIMRAAADDQLITETQRRAVCSRLELPKHSKTEKRPLTQQEKDAMKTADFTDRERAFVYIIYGCGLRRGEALALTWADIDCDAGILTVNKALAYDGNNPYVKSTKTANSVRKIPMPSWLSTYLREYRHNTCGLHLFSSKNCEWITHSSYVKMWSNIVRKMNAAAGGCNDVKIIYDLTAHIFRHNYCTQLCYSGLSIKKVAELLGDSEKMVMEVYSHILEEKEQAEDKIELAMVL